MDLFDAGAKAAQEKDSPLAARMRPRKLDDYIGQRHIVGPGRLLRRAIQADQLSSVIFYGPPGTGKTTLARIIANTTRGRFIAINAVLSGVKEIREAIDTAEQERKYHGRRSILFVDEVHRFNKAQQDALLPHVENGTIILIGATTENPYFEVNKALVSRSRIFQLRPLDEEDIRGVVLAALADEQRGYGRRRVILDEEALQHLVRMADGDARAALNALELAVETTQPGSDGEVRIGLGVAEESIQRRAVLYDKDGDAHYDTISAFIKSVRGSDPDAALYWLAKMVYAGEDARFLFRRMLILASEDVGLADPHALEVVSAAARAYDYVGMPEGQFHLAQACLYLATAPKSNSTMAYFDVLEAVGREQADEVPDHLKDGSRDGADLGHGKGYKYPHAFREHWVAQQYLPGTLQGRLFYEPSEQGYEGVVREDVLRRREAQLAAAMETEIVEREAPRRSGNRWLERALSQSGEILGRVRSEIFRLAAIKRDDLILDLSGTTGLLTWEALRASPTGGVWTRCTSEKESEALEEWCTHVGLLDRPRLFICTPELLGDWMAALGAEMPRFDAILGYHLLEHAQDDHRKLLTEWSRLLAPAGRLILADRNPTLSQQPTEGLRPGELSPALASKVAALLEMWRNETDAEWVDAHISKGNTSESLGLNPNGEVGQGLSEEILSRDFVVPRRFPAAQVRAWLDGPSAQAGHNPNQQEFGNRSEEHGNKLPSPSFALRLYEALTIEEAAELREALLTGLSRRESPWRHSYRFHTVRAS